MPPSDLRAVPPVPSAIITSLNCVTGCKANPTLALLSHDVGESVIDTDGKVDGSHKQKLNHHFVILTVKLDIDQALQSNIIVLNAFTQYF